MKKIFKILALIAIQIITNLDIKASEQPNFNIIGHIKGLKNEENLFILVKNGNSIDTVSRAKAKNGAFIFKDVILPDRLCFYLICIQTEFVENLQLFLDQAGDIEIKGELGSWPTVEIIGAKAHNDYLEYLKNEQKVMVQLDSIRLLNDSSADFFERRKSARELRLQLIESLSNSTILPYALLMWKDWHLDEELHPSIKWPFYNRLSDKLKDSYYGRQLRDVLGKAEQANFMKPGDVFPKITVFDENGKIEQVNDLISKNKLTLIDCWHSACKPCRKAFPFIEKIVAKYKKKGFGVIGISSDEDLATWKKALTHDKLSWPNYIQNEKSLSKKFDLYALGNYFLVDNEGKVIAFDGSSKIMKSFGGGISYEELDKKLEELLGKN
jgi:thiol-disulfide isomerase/thioredoxin